MKKYYYLDENGNKKNYIGKIINDYITGETYGLLTQQEVSHKEIELEYHPKVESQEGWASYFTYTDASGNDVKYNGLKYNIKQDPINNSYFFTQLNTIKIDLIKHDKVDYVPGYYTYLGRFGKEIKYEGEVFYDKFTNSYYFYK